MTWLDTGFTNTHTDSLDPDLWASALRQDLFATLPDKTDEHDAPSVAEAISVLGQLAPCSSRATSTRDNGADVDLRDFGSCCIGSMIRARRQSLGLTQLQLAARCSMKQSRISNLENSNGGNFRTLRRIAAALHCDLCVGFQARKP